MEAEVSINFVPVLQRDNIAVVTIRFEGDASDREPRDRRAVYVRKFANTVTGLGRRMPLVMMSFLSSRTMELRGFPTLGPGNHGAIPVWQPGDRLTCVLGLGREHRSGRTGEYAGAPREVVPDGLLLYLDVRSSSFVVLRFPYAELADDENAVARVLTDNGCCYRSRAFTAAHGESITHKFTRPYRLQTSGKVERFNRTLAQELAYAETCLSDAARAAT